MSHHNNINNFFGGVKEVDLGQLTYYFPLDAANYVGSNRHDDTVGGTKVTILYGSNTPGVFAPYEANRARLWYRTDSPSYGRMDNTDFRLGDGTTDFSHSAFVAVSPDNIGPQPLFLFDKRFNGLNGGTTEREFSFFIEANGTFQIKFFDKTDNSKAILAISSVATALVNGEEAVIGWSYDEPTKDLRVFKNGVDVTETQTTDAEYVCMAGATGTLYRTYWHRTGGGTRYSYNGKMQDVGFAIGSVWGGGEMLSLYQKILNDEMPR